MLMLFSSLKGTGGIEVLERYAFVTILVIKFFLVKKEHLDNEVYVKEMTNVSWIQTYKGTMSLTCKIILIFYVI